MLRKTILRLSTQPRIRSFVRKNRLARFFASRFVAGETLDSAAEYLTLLERMAAAHVEVNVSVKSTQMGLDLDPALCERNLRRILDLFERFHPRYGAGVGVVIQAALHRSTGDIECLITRTIRVRLCKGASLEPATLAYADKADVDAHYQRLMERLLVSGHYPGIATHDERLIRHARRFADSNGIGRDRFEFQMLYGVRRDLQNQLRSAGWNAFILGNVIREGVSRKSIPS